MTKAEAKELLLLHSGMHENINHPKAIDGFIGILRPFKGKLIEKNFQEIREAIVVLADDLSQNDKIDRDIICAIWTICHLTRSWAIEPGGMLRRNDLISQKQTDTLHNWIDEISYNVMMLLSGNIDPETLRKFGNI